MQTLIIDFLNLILCFSWGVIAASRLGVMHKGVLLRIGWLYVVVFVASALCGLQFFLFGTHAGLSDIVASFVILGLMVASMPRWRHGPPCDVVDAPSVSGF